MPGFIQLTDLAVVRESEISGLQLDTLGDGVFAIVSGRSVRTNWKTLAEGMAALGWTLGSPADVQAEASPTPRARKARP